MGVFIVETSGLLLFHLAGEGFGTFIGQAVSQVKHKSSHFRLDVHLKQLKVHSIQDSSIGLLY